MKKTIKKINKVLQMVLLAPVKLPGKLLNLIRYLALGVGIVDEVLDDEKEEGHQGENEELKDYGES